MFSVVQSVLSHKEGGSSASTGLSSPPPSVPYPSSSSSDVARREAACGELLLRRFPCLASVSRSALHTLLKTTKVKTFSSRPAQAKDKKANVIVEEGSPLSDPVLMLIRSGSVQVLMRSPFLDRSRQRHPVVRVSRLGPGEEMGAFAVCMTKTVEEAEVEQMAKRITYANSPYTLVVAPITEQKEEEEDNAAQRKRRGAASTDGSPLPAPQYPQVTVYTLSLVAFRNLLCSQPMLFEQVQRDVLERLSFRRQQLERHSLAHTHIGGYSADRTPFMTVHSTALGRYVPPVEKPKKPPTTVITIAGQASTAASASAAAAATAASSSIATPSTPSRSSSPLRQQHPRDFDLRTGIRTHRFTHQVLHEPPRAGLPSDSTLARILSAPEPISKEEAELLKPPDVFSFHALIKQSPTPARTPLGSAPASDEEDEGEEEREEEKQAQQRTAALPSALLLNAPTNSALLSSMGSPSLSSPNPSWPEASTGPLDPMAIEPDEWDRLAELQASDDENEQAHSKYISPEEAQFRRFLRKQKLSRAHVALKQAAKEEEKYQEDLSLAIRKAFMKGLNAIPTPTASARPGTGGGGGGRETTGSAGGGGQNTPNIATELIQSIRAVSGKNAASTPTARQQHLLQPASSPHSRRPSRGPSPAPASASSSQLPSSSATPHRSLQSSNNASTATSPGPTTPKSHRSKRGSLTSSLPPSHPLSSEASDAREETVPAVSRSPSLPRDTLTVKVKAHRRAASFGTGVAELASQIQVDPPSPTAYTTRSADEASSAALSRSLSITIDTGRASDTETAEGGEPNTEETTEAGSRSVRWGMDELEREAANLLARAQARQAHKAKLQRKLASRHAKERIDSIRSQLNHTTDEDESHRRSIVEGGVMMRRFSRSINQEMFSPAMRRAMQQAQLNPHTLSAAKLAELNALEAVAHNRKKQLFKQRQSNFLLNPEGEVSTRQDPDPHSHLLVPPRKRGLFTSGPVRTADGSTGSDREGEESLSHEALESLFHLNSPGGSEGGSGSTSSSPSKRHRRKPSFQPNSSLKATDEGMEGDESASALSPQHASSSPRRHAKSPPKSSPVPIFVTPTRNSNGALLTNDVDPTTPIYAEFFQGQLNLPYHSVAAAQALAAGMPPELINADIAHRQRRGMHAQRISDALAPTALSQIIKRATLPPVALAITAPSPTSSRSRNSHLAALQHNPLNLLGFIKAPANASAGSSSKPRVAFSFGHAIPEELMPLVEGADWTDPERMLASAQASRPVSAPLHEPAAKATDAAVPHGASSPSSSSSSPTLPPLRARTPLRRPAHSLLHDANSVIAEEDDQPSSPHASRPPSRARTQPNMRGMAQSSSAPSLMQPGRESNMKVMVSPPASSNLSHSHSSFDLPDIHASSSSAIAAAPSTLPADHRRAGIFAEAGSRLTLNTLHPWTEVEWNNLRARVYQLVHEAKQRENITLADIFSFQGMENDTAAVENGLGLANTTGVRASHVLDYRSILTGGGSQPAKGVVALSVILHSFSREHPVYSTKARRFRLTKEMSGEAIKGKKQRARKKVREEEEAKRRRERKEQLQQMEQLQADMDHSEEKTAEQWAFDEEADENPADLLSPLPHLHDPTTPSLPRPHARHASSSSSLSMWSALEEALPEEEGAECEEERDEVPLLTSPPHHAAPMSSRSSPSRQAAARKAMLGGAPGSRKGAITTNKQSPGSKSGTLSQLRKLPPTATPLPSPPPHAGLSLNLLASPLPNSTTPTPSHADMTQALTFLTLADPALIEQALAQFNFLGLDVEEVAQQAEAEEAKEAEKQGEEPSADKERADGATTSQEEKTSVDTSDKEDADMDGEYTDENEEQESGEEEEEYEEAGSGSEPEREEYTDAEQEEQSEAGELVPATYTPDSSRSAADGSQAAGTDDETLSQLQEPVSGLTSLSSPLAASSAASSPTPSSAEELQQPAEEPADSSSPPQVDEDTEERSSTPALSASQDTAGLPAPASTEQPAETENARVVIRVSPAQEEQKMAHSQSAPAFQPVQVPSSFVSSPFRLRRSQPAAPPQEEAKEATKPSAVTPAATPIKPSLPSQQVEPKAAPFPPLSPAPLSTSTIPPSLLPSDKLLCDLPSDSMRTRSGLKEVRVKGSYQQRPDSPKGQVVVTQSREEMQRRQVEEATKAAAAAAAAKAKAAPFAHMRQLKWGSPAAQGPTLSSSRSSLSMALGSSRQSSRSSLAEDPAAGLSSVRRGLPRSSFRSMTSSRSNRSISPSARPASTGTTQVLLSSRHSARQSPGRLSPIHQQLSQRSTSTILSEQQQGTSRQDHTLESLHRASARSLKMSASSPQLHSSPLGSDRLSAIASVDSSRASSAAASTRPLAASASASTLPRRSPARSRPARSPPVMAGGMSVDPSGRPVLVWAEAADYSSATHMQRALPFPSKRK